MMKPINSGTAEAVFDAFAEDCESVDHFDFGTVEVGLNDSGWIILECARCGAAWRAKEGRVANWIFEQLEGPLQCLTREEIAEMEEE